MTGEVIMHRFRSLGVAAGAAQLAGADILSRISTAARRPGAAGRHNQEMSLLAFIGLFAAVVATWIAVSGPGEAALVSAGTIAARGEDGIAPILIIAFLGTFAGSLAAYWLGRAGGRRLLLWPGPLMVWRTRLLVRSEGVIQRRAFLASLLGPGWLAGINEVPPRPFIAGSALSGLLWTLTIGLGAFFVGPSLIALYDDVGRWMTVAALVAAGSAALLIFARRTRART